MSSTPCACRDLPPPLQPPLRDELAAVLRATGYPVRCPTTYGAVETGCLARTCVIAIIDIDCTAPEVAGQLSCTLRAARPMSEVGLLLLERYTAAQLSWLDKPAYNQLCDAVLRIPLDPEHLLAWIAVISARLAPDVSPGGICERGAGCIAPHRGGLLAQQLCDHPP